MLNLVLSGGGVKGAAHIGAIKALEENNIEISGISGTSSGSIVAALYACGYKAEEIYYIFKRYCKYIADYDHMIPFKVLNTLFTGKIKLKSLAHGNNIEYLVDNFARCKGKVFLSDVKIPLVIPAVNIIDGRIIYFNNRENNRLLDTTKFEDEPLYLSNVKICDAVRASTAYPGIFYPKKVNNFYLVDGGVRVNSPVSALKKINKEAKTFTIYFEKIDNNRLPNNIIETTIKSFDIMAHEINQKEIEKSDYRIDIESRNVGLLDISKIDYMVNLGYIRCKDLIKENDLQKLVKKSL